jgi:hypothetical protein
MRIGISGSMHHTEKMVELAERLTSLGHEPFLSSAAAAYVGKSDDEKERLKLQHKFHNDAIRDYWRQMQGADALLVANYERRGIPNYIGGNAFMEIGFSHVLDQKLFLLNPVPDIEIYRSEIEAMAPVVLNGDLTAIR